MTRPAQERNETDHAEYQLLIGMYFEPRQLVFADESAFDRQAARQNYAWAPMSHQARRQDFFIHGKQYSYSQVLPIFESHKQASYSILPAMSLDGILVVEILDQPFNGTSFLKFVEGLLDQMNPWPQNNSVLTMDNASIHKSDTL